MSLWWAKKEQLDDTQVAFIEDLPLDGKYLIVGPPGSGKTNILLRRAQFCRMQNRPNVQVLTFTRPLTEFLRTGCYNADGKEHFPPSLLNTYESWQRQLHRDFGADLPQSNGKLLDWKAHLAESTKSLLAKHKAPPLDALFIDEAQDLLPEEVDLLIGLSDNIYCVGDKRQKIYGGADGLESLRVALPSLEEKSLPFHYRLAPEICEVADRIQQASGVESLSATEHYSGPKPGRVDVDGPVSRDDQIDAACEVLSDQVRVYADLIANGDKLGIIVPRKSDRDEVFSALEADARLAGKSQVLRARTGESSDADFSPVIDPSRPILILTPQGAKGIEFRAVQWLFADDLEGVYTPEVYYTVVTRAKTTVDIYYDNNLPAQIAKACAPKRGDIW